MQMKNTSKWLLPLIFLILFISLYSGIDAWAKKNVICSYCGEEIRGQYVLIDGEYYHPIHFKCDNCGTPIGHTTYYKKDNKYYCEKCFDKLFARRCTYCGGVIDKDGIVVNGLNYHRSCYNDNVAKRCAVCSEVIFDNYYLDYWGNAYHQKHLDSLDQCRYCGRLICESVTYSGVVYDDGRHVCNLCRRTVVNDISDAEKLMDTTLLLLEMSGIKLDSQNISLRLVNSDELKKITGADIELQEGYTICNKTIVGSEVIEQKNDVYILDGKPREYFIGDMAHELMHIWLCIYAAKDIKSALAEGSCNYASYLVLKRLNSTYAEYIISNLKANNDPDYGEGFRRVMSLVEYNGIEYWLYYLKQSKDFPSGY
ncbi:MAG: LIM domain-containing protein [Candidatus Zixiibacteriota bacterium]